MEKYERHIFICLGKRCKKKGSEEIMDAFKEASKREGLKGPVLTSRSGCIKACKITDIEGEYSPLAVVYPEGVWYRNIRTGDVDEIVTEHLKSGRAVERLLLHRNF